MKEQAMPLLRWLLAGFHSGGLGQVMCDLWCTKSYWSRFSPSTSVPLPICILLIAPQSSSSVIWCCYNGPNSGCSIKWTQSHPMRERERERDFSLYINGKELRQFRTYSQLRIINTFYQNKNIHKFTWSARGTKSLYHC
jgi:hypothetical protein